MATLRLPDRNTSKKRSRIVASAALGSVQNISHENKFALSTSVHMPITKNAQFTGTAANVVFTQPMFFSPLHTPQNWQTPSKRREQIQWARFYYDNEPKVAAAIDFYSYYAITNFKIECKNRKVLKYFEQLVEDLELDEWLRYISFDYHLIGEVFPFLEIDCSVCKGSGINPKTGKQCAHPGGTFKSIRVLNPDYVEVQDNMLAKEPVIALLPDEELRMIVTRREPREIFEKLPQKLIDLVATGRPIPLSLRSVSHIKHNAAGYATYGTPMLRRLFTILAYKTKIMTANWITAERLILPVRLVKVGEKDRPASDEDILAVQQQLAAVANDPNQTIVTHHALEIDWVGATSKIHDISKNLEEVGKEILDGLMINQALLNGEAAAYASSQVGVEILLKRLETWQNRLKKWVENHIFKPVAMMQGFIDEEKSRETGKKVPFDVRLKWDSMELRDKTNYIQLLFQANDKGWVSGQTICEELDLDYDTEIQRRREESLVAQSTGEIMGMGGANQGTMGMGAMVPGAGGGGLGGMPGMEGPGGMPGGDMGMGMGGPAGGAGAGGAGGAGGMMGGGMGAAASGPMPKVMKRGKAHRIEKDQPPPVPPQVLHLTKLEQKLKNILYGMNLPFKLFAQYQIKLAGHPQPFLLDFAYPSIGVGAEADGQPWHEREDLQQRDKMRDQKLASIGWRILRFKEEALEDHPDLVRDVILENVKEAAKERKSAYTNGNMQKYASMTEFINDSDIQDSLKVRWEDLDNIGYRILIGN